MRAWGRGLVTVAVACGLAAACTPASMQMSRALDVMHDATGLRFRIQFAPDDAEVAVSVRKAVEQALLKTQRWGHPEAPITVLIYPDHGSLVSAIGGHDYAWLRAWARFDEVMLQSPRTWGIDYTDQLPELITHEMTHVVMYQRVATEDMWEDKEIPLWFREGMASWTAGQGYRRGRPDEIGRFLAEHPEADPLRPDPDFLRDHKDHVYNSGHWSFSFLVRSGGEERIVSLMDAMRNGAGFEAAFERVYGYDEKEFLARWRHAITKTAVPPGEPDAPAEPEPPGSGGDAACSGSARLEPATVPPGGRATLTVEAVGEGVDRPVPVRGALDGVTVLSTRSSTSISIDRGQVHARQSLVMTVSPKAPAGAVSLGPFELRGPSGTCRIEAVTLLVAGSADQPAATAPPPPPPESRRDILLRVRSGVIQPGGAAEIEYVFPRGVRSVELLRPDFPGAWSDELLLPDRVGYRLDPIFYGDLVAAPLVANATVSGGLFRRARRVRLESDPLELRFLPPPAPPAGLAELLRATARHGGASDKTLVVALDLSSSLRKEDVGASRLTQIGRVLDGIAKALDPAWSVGLVPYREGAFTYLAPGPGPARLADALGWLRWDDLPEDGSGTGTAVMQALRHLHPLAGARHVVVMSDGACGPVGVSCSTAGRVARALGIPVSSVIVGWRADGTALDRVAATTGGRVVRLQRNDDVDQAVRALLDELSEPPPAGDLSDLRMSNLPMAWRRLEEMDRHLRADYFSQGRPGSAL